MEAPRHERGDPGRKHLSKKSKKPKQSCECVALPLPSLREGVNRVSGPSLNSHNPNADWRGFNSAGETDVFRERGVVPKYLPANWPGLTPETKSVQNENHLSFEPPLPLDDSCFFRPETFVGGHTTTRRKQAPTLPSRDPECHTTTQTLPGYLSGHQAPAKPIHSYCAPHSTCILSCPHLEGPA